MKTVIRIVLVSALLAAAAQAVTPKIQTAMGFSNSGPVPLCMPKTPCD